MGQVSDKMPRSGTSKSRGREKESNEDKGTNKGNSEVKTYSADTEYHVEGFPLMDVPDDILFEVLKWVPADHIVKSCVYVCRQWKGVIDTQMFWKEKCVQDFGYTNEIFHYLIDEDFKKLYFKRPYQNNLIKNPDASAGFKCWTIHKNGGNQWKIEEPIGCHPLEQFTGNELATEMIAFQSGRIFQQDLMEPNAGLLHTLKLCSKSQTIDLVERGCSAQILDDVRPDICVSEWYAARSDCGIEYKIRVQLLKTENDKVPVKEWIFEDTRPAGRDWFKVDHTFSNYEPGVRYVKYYHEGKDTQFWAGWYGAKMTLSSVILDLTHTCTASDSTAKTS